MDFLIAAHTDVGIRKKTNQDSVLIKVADTDCGKVCFAAVCDGMGGLRKGELASATLIRDFSDWFDSEFPEILYEGLDTIVLRKSWERVVSICAKELERYSSDNQVRMGTTAAVLLLAQHRYFILNIGDAEYILVEGEMAFLKKEYRKALGDFKKAKETAADEEVRQKGASFYAKTCITLTDYQEAIKTLEAKGEYELADWMNLAFAYKCTGNWKKSKELLLQAVLYYPEDYRLYMRLCYLECELQDRKPQALKDYSQLKVYYDKAVSLLNGKTGNEEWIQLKSLIVQLKEYGWM